MPADFFLRGPEDNVKARVSQFGELVCAPYAYSKPYFQNMGTAATAYNFVEPKQNQFFVITGIIVQANKNVNATTGQIVDIYEADEATDTTIDTSIIEIELIKNDKVVMTPLNIAVTAGKFVNGKTEDDDVLATVFGYYVSDNMVG